MTKVFVLSAVLGLSALGMACGGDTAANNKNGNTNAVKPATPVTTAPATPATTAPATPATTAPATSTMKPADAKPADAKPATPAKATK